MTTADLPVWMRYDLDPTTIDQVVTHINRVRPSAQRRLAKDVVTIAYLDAGRRLVERSLDASETTDGVVNYLDWLTREAVCAEMQRGAWPLPRQAGEGSFRDRWRSKGDYLADLVGYLSWNLHWEPHRRLAFDALLTLLNSDLPLADAVEAVAFLDMELLTGGDHKTARLTQVALQPLIVNNPKARETISKLYTDVLKAWGDTYAGLLDGRGMRLRPDTSLDDLAVILTAVADGLAMRALVDGPDCVMDREARTSLLGTAAFALLAAFVDPGDGRTVRQIVDELGERHPPGPT